MADRPDRPAGRQTTPRRRCGEHELAPLVPETSTLTVTVEEAAALLGISRTLAYELVGRGDLPCLRLGRRIVISRRALERMVDASHGS